MCTGVCVVWLRVCVHMWSTCPGGEYVWCVCTCMDTVCSRVPAGVGVTHMHVCALNRAGQPSRPAWSPAPSWLCGLGATLSRSTQPSFVRRVKPTPQAVGGP